MSRPCGVSYLVMVTADLDRYRVFYEDTIGVDTALVLAAGPGHGRRAVAFVSDVMFHVLDGFSMLVFRDPDNIQLEFITLG
jgi:hypothetical protein